MCAGQLENAADSHAASLAPLISSCQQEVTALQQELEEGRTAAAQDHQEQTAVKQQLAEVRAGVTMCPVLLRCLPGETW